MIKSFIIAMMTTDGLIARHDYHAALWSSKEDKQFFSKRTKEAGVIVMGAKTFATMGQALPGRLNIVYTPDPISVEGVETTTLPPQELLASLEKRGFKEVAICGGSTIYTMFLKAGVVEKLYLTIEPKIFGQGLSLANQELDLTLKLVSTQQLSSDVVLLEYLII